MLKRSLTLMVTALAVARSWRRCRRCESMYSDALAKEQAVRKALANPQMTDVVLKAVREVVASYETLVRHYPASAYSDDALWNAGRLELDAFARFHRQTEKEAAATLFAQLAAGYPSSKFVKQIPADLTRMSARGAPAAARRAEIDAASTHAPVEPTEPVAAAAPERNRSLDSHQGSPPGRAAGHRARDDRARRRGAVSRRAHRGSRSPFLDLPATRPAQPLVDRTIRFDSDSDIVRQVRIGRHPNHVTRIVLDANGVSSYSVYPSTAHTDW